MVVKNWEFNELIDAIKENFYSFKESNTDLGQVAERCFYEFENVINDGATEKWIVNSTIGSLIGECGKITKRQHDRIIESLNSFDRLKVLSELQSDEVEKLEVQIKEVKKAFCSLEVI
jgi:hypothetical protein